MVKLTIHLIKMCIKREMQYKLNFFLLCVVVMPIRIVQLFFAWLIATKINGIMGWNAKDLVFLYSVFMVSYSITQIFFRHFRFLGNMVLQGNLDIWYIKPQPILYTTIFYNVHIMEIFSQLFPSICILFYFISVSNIDWNIYKGIVLISGIVGGTIIQSSIFILIGSISFFTMKANWLGEVYYTFRDYMTYPLSIFGKKMLNFLTYIFPLAFVSYYPVKYILEKEERSILDVLTLPVSLIVLAITLLIWKISLKKYNSAGS